MKFTSNMTTPNILRRRQRGFTIVELLIVIVVIAILAAISIVAYTGIQNRAYDSAIQNDLRNLAQRIQLYHAEHGNYPQLGRQVGDGSSDRVFPGITFTVSASAYAPGVPNLYVCATRTEPQVYGVAAHSRSGRTIAYRLDRGFVEYGAGWPTGSTSQVVCPELLGVSGTTSYWYTYGRSSAGAWDAPWAQG